jgi:UDP-2-acetamido-2,6-beta-L-arabino-hexul-4-ose reductase
MIIGINGNGFIGYHLWCYFHYKCDDVHVIQLNRNLHNDLDNLSKCDVVIHLAEKNRGDEQELYKNNISSTNDLVAALTQLNHQPLVIYTSSVHEDDDNIYGQWRRENKSTFSTWAKNNNFISIKLPNIFGPFCKPNYNSFVATLCDSLIISKQIKLSDNTINLLYVENLCKQIHDIIKGTITSITHDCSISVIEIFNILSRFCDEYYKKGQIPELHDEFQINLFATFRSYIQSVDRKFSIKRVADNRGELKELVIFKEHGQIFYSTTKPGIVRGNHFHTKRIERFCIVKGTAQISMRRVGTNQIISYIINDTDNIVIDMPPYYTHNLTNVGSEDLICVFWMNDILHEQHVDDTYFEGV